MKRLLCTVLLLLTGCVAIPIVHRLDQPVHTAQTERFHKKITELAQEGDWIVTLGYHASDALVVSATGIPLSHVGAYDPERRQVIEAEGKGVHASALRDFIDKSHRLIVIHPRWSTPGNRHTAILNARALVGRDYDYLGTIGFDSPDRYYCSELAVKIYRQWHSTTEHFPPVIKPGELYLWGAVIYDSLPRDYLTAK